LSEYINYYRRIQYNTAGKNIKLLSVLITNHR